MSTGPAATAIRTLKWAGGVLAVTISLLVASSVLIGPVYWITDRVGWSSRWVNVSAAPFVASAAATAALFVTWGLLRKPAWKLVVAVIGAMLAMLSWTLAIDWPNPYVVLDQSAAAWIPGPLFVCLVAGATAATRRGARRAAPDERAR